ncbi:hypothetical protein CbC4_6009 (plasmid) [Clostridium botulinum BKT015925]|nr:hypothetical protein CbC4_6009 [Clostridium botulinum BKT015925]
MRGVKFMNFKTKKEDLISLNISGILTIIVAIVENIDRFVYF